MDLRVIENLLDKYFDAATTTAQEKQLKAYFSSPDVAPHLEQYRPMFGYFTQEETHQFEKTIPLQPRKRNKAAWISVAASVVVLFGLFTFLNSQPSQEELGTYDDPEVAFRETQKALNMLSQNVNVGITGVNYLGEYEKSKETIFKE